MEKPGSEATTEGMTAGGHYDAHSEYQRRVIESGDRMLRPVLASLPLPPDGEALALVDYGASTGGTSVHAMATAVGAIRERDAERPINVVHNDVISNDFNQLFRNIAGEGSYLRIAGGPVFASAAAGSFFEQVVPPASVHLGTCSNASHWLREQPGVSIPDGMYFCEATGDARAAIAEQAAADWLAFLGARAAELAPGGRFVVQGIGSDDEGRRASASRLLRVMWQVADGLAEEGLLDGSHLDGYVFPVYCRSPAEVTAPAAEGGPLAGALTISSHELEEVSNPYWETFEQSGDAGAYAEAYVEFVRGFAESSLLEHLFTPAATGIAPDALCEEYFKRLREATAKDPEAGRYEAWIVRAEFERVAAASR
jgi:hypothetical protein